MTLVMRRAYFRHDATHGVAGFAPSALPAQGQNDDIEVA